MVRRPTSQAGQAPKSPAGTLWTSIGSGVARGLHFTRRTMPRRSTFSAAFFNPDAAHRGAAPVRLYTERSDPDGSLLRPGQTFARAQFLTDFRQ